MKRGAGEKKKTLLKEQTYSPTCDGANDGLFIACLQSGDHEDAEKFRWRAVILIIISVWTENHNICWTLTVGAQSTDSMSCVYNR